MRETSSYEAHSLLSGDDVILSINGKRKSLFHSGFVFAEVLFPNIQVFFSDESKPVPKEIHRTDFVYPYFWRNSLWTVRSGD
jgi:hypothetical protein